MVLLKINVPYMPDSHIELAAKELLLRYAKLNGAPPRPPIPVENIVESLLNISFEIEDLREMLGMSDVLGATWLDDGLMIVDSSLDDQPGRFAFTLAHEVGHYVLHRPFIEMDKVTLPLFPRSADEKPKPALVCRSAQRKERLEIQADKFAASLLMPASDVTAFAMQVNSNCPLRLDGVQERQAAWENDPVLRDFAAAVIDAGNFENVSNSAMRVRLLDLNLVEYGPQQTLF